MTTTTFVYIRVESYNVHCTTCTTGVTYYHPTHTSLHTIYSVAHSFISLRTRPTGAVSPQTIPLYVTPAAERSEPLLKTYWYIYRTIYRKLLESMQSSMIYSVI